jgi:hypothetical protein
LVPKLKKLGSIKTSKTFPSLCRATMDTAIANLETVARITTIDYNGSVQESGGDPVTAEIVDDQVLILSKCNGVCNSFICMYITFKKCI